MAMTNMRDYNPPRYDEENKITKPGIYPVKINSVVSRMKNGGFASDIFLIIKFICQDGAFWDGFYSLKVDGVWTFQKMLHELQIPEDEKEKLSWDEDKPWEYDHFFVSFTKEYLIGKSCVLHITERTSKTGAVSLVISKYEPTTMIVQAPNIVLKDKNTMAIQTSSDMPAGIRVVPANEDDTPF